ncbi:MAG: tRNA (N6-isopentenyl adenosine(37)-C2)-methylthiotransferase MiaB [Chloroflexi bacterium RBG_16_48_8]|nr:MAG: tRNA (N6-isopentenyl adenosine(37)-C2)-methylthiotransferase MiaB [Chloroflexi bacterium RBG_16_48_8]
MKYHIWTAGCQMNVADSHRVASSLEKLGYQATQQAEEADVIVLNTCVVRQSAEDKAYGRLNSLRPLKAQRPDMVINLMGCLVGIKGNPKLAATFPFVDVFSPPSDPRPLIEYLSGQEGKDVELAETTMRHALMDEEFLLPQDSRDRLVCAFVPIVLGCSHACSFCVIPFRRGAEKSRSVEAIVKEVKAFTLQGVQEVTLLGQIVDRYGLDLSEKPSLSKLLRTIHEIKGLERIRFLTSHPNWLTDELLNTVAELPKVCEHIEVPVQAGDDKILQRMKRGYTSDDYRHLIEKIRRRIPGVMIASDVIVGFPGETREQFQHTYDLLEELQLDVVHLARYSPRPGTLSARRMVDNVSEEEKMDRFRALEELQARVAAKINAQHFGQEVEILVEGKQSGRWKGRTRTNKLVFFDSPADMQGKFVKVFIEWTGPWSMRGYPVLHPQTEAIPQIA